MRRGRLLGLAIAIAAAFLLLAAPASAGNNQINSKNATKQGYGGVSQQSSPPSSPAQNAQGVGAAQASGSAALPFTGLQLGVFVVVGLALLGGGLLLRRASRSSS
jgi:hypothetical protein